LKEGMSFEEWKNKKNLKLNIAENYFHHHAFEIISANKFIYDHFNSLLNSSIDIQPIIRSSKNDLKKSIGINANSLNKNLREKLKISNDKIQILFEVFEENGVFYFSTEDNGSIGGFDFAILNNEENLVSLRNLCFGSLQYHDGEKRWQKYIEKNPSLKNLADEILIRELSGKNIPKIKTGSKSPLIVGEIQFGNWALVYRDFFKVLKADVLNNIDCLIYIVPTGNLEQLLSKGIVTYNKTVKIIEEFNKVINVPVWVIGIDVEM